MPALTFESLYASRCRNGEVYYWKPQDITNVGYTVEDSGVPDAIARILASAELLEVDVRHYVSKLVHSPQINDLPLAAKNLLISNLGDESVHYGQFLKAIDAYSVSDQVRIEAGCISEQWQQAEGHPLQKAAILEVGVFTACSLPILRRCGGHFLSKVSQMVSEDEQRHVATNLGVLKALGYNPFEYLSGLEELRKETVSWLLDGFNIKKWGINKDWVLKQSNSMTHEGRAPQLSAWTSAYVDAMPFENSNKLLAY